MKYYRSSFLAQILCLSMLVSSSGLAWAAPSVGAKRPRLSRKVVPLWMAKKYVNQVLDQFKSPVLRDLLFLQGNSPEDVDAMVELFRQTTLTELRTKADTKAELPMLTQAQYQAQVDLLTTQMNGYARWEETYPSGVQIGESVFRAGLDAHGVPSSSPKVLSQEAKSTLAKLIVLSAQADFALGAELNSRSLQKKIWLKEKVAILACLTFLFSILASGWSLVAILLKKAEIAMYDLDPTTVDPRLLVTIYFSPLPSLVLMLFGDDILNKSWKIAQLRKSLILDESTFLSTRNAQLIPVFERYFLLAHKMAKVQECKNVLKADDAEEEVEPESEKESQVEPVTLVKKVSL